MKRSRCNHGVETLARVVVVALVVDGVCQLVVPLEENGIAASRGVDDPHDDVSVARRQGERGEEVGERPLYERGDMDSQKEMVIEPGDAVFPFADNEVLFEQAGVVAELAMNVDGVGARLLGLQEQFASVSDSTQHENVERPTTHIGMGTYSLLLQHRFRYFGLIHLQNRTTQVITLWWEGHGGCSSGSC